MKEILLDPATLIYSLLITFFILLHVGMYWDYRRQKHFENVD